MSKLSTAERLSAIPFSELKSMQDHLSKYWTHSRSECGSDSEAEEIYTECLNDIAAELKRRLVAIWPAIKTIDP